MLAISSLNRGIAIGLVFLAASSFGCAKKELGGAVKCGVGLDPQNLMFASKEISARQPFRCIFSGVRCARPEIVIRTSRVVGDLEEQVGSHNEDWSSDLNSIITNENVDRSGTYRIRLVCGAEPLARADFSARCAMQPENVRDWLEISQTEPKCLDSAYVCRRFKKDDFMVARGSSVSDIMAALRAGSRDFEEFRRISGCPSEPARAEKEGMRAPAPAAAKTRQAPKAKQSGYAAPFDN
jgi:hypothetical protein